MEEDAQLYVQARAGDGDAFARLVNRHKHGLVNYMSRLAGSRERAEDFAQEAFLRLYEGRGNYQPERGSFRSYLYRIATNLLIGEERRRKRWLRLLPQLHSSNGHHHEPTQHKRLVADEMHSRLHDALEHVPIPFRSALVLHHLEGWSYADIAQSLECSIGTVKSRIFRARRILHEELSPYWEAR